MPKGDGYGGRQARRWVAKVLATYGTTCHLCHHDRADSADHLTTRAELVARGQLQLMYAVSNGRPVHHKPCPVCGVRCNSRRKAKPLAAAPAVDQLAAFFDAAPRTMTSKPGVLSRVATTNRAEGTER